MGSWTAPTLRVRPSAAKSWVFYWPSAYSRDRVLDARQGIPTLRRNPIRLVGLVPPEIGIPRSLQGASGASRVPRTGVRGREQLKCHFHADLRARPPETSSGVG